MKMLRRRYEKFVKSVSKKEKKKIKKIPIKFDAENYLKYFNQECQKKEEEKTKASTDAEAINSILFKKTKAEKELEELEKNFYSIEYKPLKFLKKKKKKQYEPPKELCSLSKLKSK